MTLFPTDRILASVRVADAVSYLRSTGWVEQRSPRPGAVLFAGPRADDGESIVQILPLNERSREYPLRIEELLSSLSALEGRSPADILWDIITPDCDRVIFRIGPSPALLGSVGLDDGLQLMDDARELVRRVSPVTEPTSHWRLRTWPAARFTFAVELPFAHPEVNGSSVSPERERSLTLADQLAVLEQSAGTGPDARATPLIESLDRLLGAAPNGEPLAIQIVFGRTGSQSGPPAREFVFTRAARERLSRLPAAS